MSLRRLNKIAFQFAQELIRRLKAPNSVLVQKAAENVLKKVGVGVPLPLRKPARLPFRRTLLRGFRHVVRQRFPLLRPFATLHFHQQRLRELDQARRNGFLLMKEQPGKRDVLQRIRNIFGTNVRYNQALAVTEMPDRLDGYEIGQHIAKGCNGAVYELRLQIERNGEEISQRIDSFNGFPLALKIMFNYQFDAPEHVLWREMGPELVPLAKPPSGLQGGRMANIKTLPRPHPNLIKLHTAFIDRMPVLPGADQLYPDALPNLSDYQGHREPKTLFVVMKRYRMTLHEYLGTHKRNLWVGRLLVGQLLEAVVFLHQNRICHRDMKSDNVLLDFDSDGEVPHLVLSDFGSALATGSWVQPFRDEYANLGGNMAIRAPEVRRARHGPNAVVDFEMADIWAAGTLAYEIFTKRNPFYALLSSAKYTEADLPPLPHRLIEPIKRLVGQMLRVNPRERPKPEVAANVLAISLFRFGNDIRQFFQSCGLHWFWSVENMRSAFSDINEKVERKIGDLTELYATETILARLIDPAMISRAELQLRATFLSRVDRDGLRPALRYFFDDRDGIASAMDNGLVDGDVSFFPNAKSTSQCE